MPWDHTETVDRWTLRLRRVGDTYEADVRAPELATLVRYINTPSDPACRAIDAAIRRWLTEQGLGAMTWPPAFDGVHGRHIEEVWNRNPDQVRSDYPGWEQRRDEYPAKPWIFSSAGPKTYTHPA